MPTPSLDQEGSLSASSIIKVFYHADARTIYGPALLKVENNRENKDGGEDTAPSVYSHDKHFLIEHIRSVMQGQSAGAVFHFYIIQIQPDAKRFLKDVLVDGAFSDLPGAEDDEHNDALDLLEGSEAARLPAAPETLCFTPVALHPKRFKRPGFSAESREIFMSSDLVVQVVSMQVDLDHLASALPK